MKKKILEVLLGSLKAKIITGVVATLVVGGIVTGGIVYNNKINNITHTDNENKLKSDIPDDTALTEEEAKERDEALALEEIEVSKSEGSKKAEEEASKQAEEEKKNAEAVHSNPDTSGQNTNQGNGGNSTPTSTNSNSGGQPQQPSTPVQQPSEPVEQPKPAPTPVPVKKDSYWNDSLAQQAVANLSNESTNNYSTQNRSYTKDAYNSYTSISESFKNGNISAATAQSQIKGVKFDMVGMMFHHTDVSVGQMEVAGNASAKDISNAVARQGGGPNYIYIRVYYNGDTDRNIVYFVCSGTAVPV